MLFIFSGNESGENRDDETDAHAVEITDVAFKIEEDDKSCLREWRANKNKSFGSKPLDVPILRLPVATVASKLYKASLLHSNGRRRPYQDKNAVMVELDLDLPCALFLLVKLEGRSLRIDVGGERFSVEAIGEGDRELVEEGVVVGDIDETLDDNAECRGVGLDESGVSW
ncbi:hypothetical protein U1Q18_021449 [Sarracenia purpurea var. burkii]